MAFVIDRNLAKAGIVKRNKDAHKYSVGSLLSVCGSFGMTGAGILSAKSALRSGIGLLRMVVSKDIYPIMAGAVYEAVFCVLKDENDFSFSENINKHRCVLIGCGISTDSIAEKLVKEVFKNSLVPIVADADALNIIAKEPDILKTKKAPVVITPHNMEMARLMNVSLDELLLNREKFALEFSKNFDVITVLKGSETIIADSKGNVAVNTMTGNSGMAVAGSGDVLAGIIASLIAQGGDLYKSVCSGVYVHGLAGDIAKEKLGEISMLPSDIIDFLPQAFMSIS